ncbi:MAG: EAL domain-containing protein [Sulfurifustis sp.]
MDTKILRLLILDDSPDEAELTLTALRKGGYVLKAQHLNELTALQAAVKNGAPDAVISERTLRQFDVHAVLQRLRQAKLDIPVIVLTRAVPDAEIGPLMRAGARDVIVKNQLARLLPALERELAAAAERAAHRAAVRALSEIQEKYRAVVEGARDAICYSQDGMHVDANKTYLALFGYESLAELEGVPVMNLIDKSEHARFKQHIRAAAAPGAAQEFVGVRKDGTRVHVEISLAPITINGEACVQMLYTDVSQRKAVETKLEHLSRHDPLTGFANREHFLRELDQAIERARGTRGTHGLVSIDFYELRQLDKNLGHAAADRFLLAATRKLRGLFGPQAVLARCGDSEFAALVKDGTASQLRTLAEGAERGLKENVLDENGTPMKCGCRIASTLIDSATESALKTLADLYPARGHTSAPRAAAAPAAATPAAASPAPKPDSAPVSAPSAPSATEDWQTRIQAALDHGGFRLIYQPVVHLQGDVAEYFEVLVRLVAENDKLIPAGRFMPSAEETGQATAIDRWVIRHSVRALAELRRQDRRVRFFINLSAAALRDVDIVVVTQQALHEARLKPKYVIFEIDEAAVAAKPDAAAAFIRAAHAIGCGLCIDNFGTALAAANRLRDLPVEYLKLDTAFTQKLARDAAAQASLKAIVEVAKAMEKKTIAKSVESAEALSVLWTIGVDYVQGNYFQEADASLTYEFGAETTLSAEHGPSWAVANPGKNH